MLKIEPRVSTESAHRECRLYGRILTPLPLHPVIDRSFTLDEIADAFRYEEPGKHFGKICLEF
ncbi:hypothetical protein GCM10011362_04370 [Marinobacter halophilus]|nr:hypothetical protein GCM10011362_04370 [Marinobacter halophilus]